MDLVDFIAAGPVINVKIGSRERLQDRLGRFRHRGFLTDFMDGPIVAHASRRRVVIARSLSWFGRYGLRFVGHVSGPEMDLELTGRIWHPPSMTSWLCLLYAMAVILLLSVVTASLQLGGIESLAFLTAGALFVGFPFLMAVVGNAIARATNATSIQEIDSVVRSLAHSK